MSFGQRYMSFKKDSPPGNVRPRGQSGSQQMMQNDFSSHINSCSGNNFNQSIRQQNDEDSSLSYFSVKSSQKLKIQSQQYGDDIILKFEDQFDEISQESLKDWQMGIEEFENEFISSNHNFNRMRPQENDQSNPIMVNDTSNYTNKRFQKGLNANKRGKIQRQDLLDFTNTHKQINSSQAKISSQNQQKPMVFHKNKFTDLNKNQIKEHQRQVERQEKMKQIFTQKQNESIQQITSIIENIDKNCTEITRKTDKSKIKIYETEIKQYKNMLQNKDNQIKNQQLQQMRYHSQRIDQWNIFKQDNQKDSQMHVQVPQIPSLNRNSDNNRSSIKMQQSMSPNCNQESQIRNMVVSSIPEEQKFQFNNLQQQHLEIRPKKLNTLHNVVLCNVLSDADHSMSPKIKSKLSQGFKNNDSIFGQNQKFNRNGSRQSQNHQKDGQIKQDTENALSSDIISPEQDHLNQNTYLEEMIQKRKNLGINREESQQLATNSFSSESYQLKSSISKESQLSEMGEFRNLSKKEIQRFKILQQDLERLCEQKIMTQNQLNKVQIQIMKQVSYQSQTQKQLKLDQDGNPVILINQNSKLRDKEKQLKLQKLQKKKCKSSIDKMMDALIEQGIDFDIKKMESLDNQSKEKLKFSIRMYRRLVQKIKQIDLERGEIKDKMQEIKEENQVKSQNNANSKRKVQLSQQIDSSKIANENIFKVNDMKFKAFCTNTSLKSNNSSLTINSIASAHFLEQSGNSSQSNYSSKFVKWKIKMLKQDYDVYLEKNQGFLALKCQMANVEIMKIKKKNNFFEMCTKHFRDFEKIQKEIHQDQNLHKGYQTIVIDIIKTFVVKLEIKSFEEIQMLQESENFYQSYIIVDTTSSAKKTTSTKCCPFQNHHKCICKKEVYQIRPHTYDLLRAIQPFFEMIVYSKIHYKTIETIIDHIEDQLNIPVREAQKHFHAGNNDQRRQFMRIKNIPQMKMYFQYLMHENQYVQIPTNDKYIENLYLLTENRKKQDLIFISSDPFRIVAAMSEGFNTIPVVQFETFHKHDFQLALVENYILKNRHLREMNLRLQTDFSFLLNKIEKEKFVQRKTKINGEENSSIIGNHLSMGSMSQAESSYNSCLLDRNDKYTNEQTPKYFVPRMNSNGYFSLCDESKRLDTMTISRGDQEVFSNYIFEKDPYYSRDQPENNLKNNTKDNNLVQLQQKDITDQNQYNKMQNQRLSQKLQPDFMDDTYDFNQISRSADNVFMNQANEESNKIQYQYPQSSFKSHVLCSSQIDLINIEKMRQVKLKNQIAAQIQKVKQCRSMKKLKFEKLDNIPGLHSKYIPRSNSISVDSKEIQKDVVINRIKQQIINKEEESENLRQFKQNLKDLVGDLVSNISNSHSEQSSLNSAIQSNRSNNFSIDKSQNNSLKAIVNSFSDSYCSSYINKTFQASEDSNQSSEEGKRGAYQIDNNLYKQQQIQHQANQQNDIEMVVGHVQGEIDVDQRRRHNIDVILEESKSENEVSISYSDNNHDRLPSNYNSKGGSGQSNQENFKDSNNLTNQFSLEHSPNASLNLSFNNSKMDQSQKSSVQYNQENKSVGVANHTNVHQNKPSHQVNGHAPQSPRNKNLHSSGTSSSNSMPINHAVIQKRFYNNKFIAIQQKQQQNNQTDQKKIQKKILLLSSAEEDHYENPQSNNQNLEDKISESPSSSEESFDVHVIKAAYSSFKSEELIQIKKFSQEFAAKRNPNNSNMVIVSQDDANISRIKRIDTLKRSSNRENKPIFEEQKQEQQQQAALQSSLIFQSRHSSQTEKTIQNINQEMRVHEP